MVYQVLRGRKVHKDTPRPLPVRKASQLWITNLTQQIDGYQRVSQAQAAELAATNSKFNELSSAFGENKIATGNELAALVNETTALKKVLDEVQVSITSQGQALTALGDSSQDTLARLNETIEKLKKSFFVGGKFK